MNKFKNPTIAIFCIALISFQKTSIAYQEARRGKEYVLITEDYPLQTDFSFVPKNARLILITKEVHTFLTPKQKQAFDKIIVIDTFNFPNVLKAVKNHVRNYRNARLLANDDTIFRLVAKIRETLHIPGATIHDILPFCNKIESKKRLKGSSIHYPNFIAFDYEAYQHNTEKYLSQIAQKLTFPIIIKPIGLAGSLGVKKLSSLQDLANWCKGYDPKAWLNAYGRKIDFELEEFIDTDHADLYHCDSILQNGKVVFTQVCRYTYPCMEVTKGKPIGSILLPPEDPKYKGLTKLSGKVIQTFKRYGPIPDGVMHLEAFRHKKSGKITFLEVQLRPPGAGIKPMYKYSWNLDLEEIHFKLQMGLPINLKKSIKRKPSTAWIFFPTLNGSIDELIIPKLKSKILKIEYLIQAEQKTNLPTSLLMGNQTALKLLITNENYQELLKDFEYLKSFQPFLLKESSSNG